MVSGSRSGEVWKCMCASLVRVEMEKELLSINLGCMDHQHNPLGRPMGCGVWLFLVLRFICLTFSLWEVFAALTDLEALNHWQNLLFGLLPLYLPLALKSQFCVLLIILHAEAPYWLHHHCAHGFQFLPCGNRGAIQPSSRFWIYAFVGIHSFSLAKIIWKLQVLWKAGIELLIR